MKEGQAGDLEMFTVLRAEMFPCLITASSPEPGFLLVWVILVKISNSDFLPPGRTHVVEHTGTETSQQCDQSHWD